MKLLTICAALALAATASAQTTLTYSNGTLGRNNVARVGTGSKQGMAIRLSHEKLQLLKGKSITTVEAVLGSANTTGKKVRGFITTDLNATPNVEKSVSISRATTTWTSISLDDPYTITGEEPELYVGVDMEIANTYQALSVDFSADSKGHCYVLNDDKWEDSFGKGLGSVNVRAVLDDDMQNYTDAIVKDFSVNGYYKVDGNYDFSTELFNFGSTTINSFDLTISGGGIETKTTHITGANVAPQGVYTLKLPTINPSTSGSSELKVEISNINGSQDADVTDNRTAADVFFYPANMERSLLVEEFTGTACVNCPSGQRTLAAALAATKHQYVEILHHAGYQPDAYTMDISSDYVSFYGGSSTYAPACMINRTTCVDAVPVFNVGTSLINGALDYCSKQQPYASLALQTTWNAATREYEVAVTVDCHNDMPEGLNVMNVILVQDHIAGSQTGVDGTYDHRYVCRGSLLGNAWGGLLEEGSKAGETITWKKTFTLPETIAADYWGENSKYKVATDPKNMIIVAYIAHHDNESIHNRQVFNAVEAHLGSSHIQAGIASGIEEIHSNASSIRDSRVFNLAGQRVNSNAKGIVISNGRKIVNK